MGLMNAFPDLDAPAATLAPIEGSPPDLHHPPPGCRFAPRCPFALPVCTTTPPPSLPVAAGHLAACPPASPEGAALRTLAREPATWSR